MDMVGGQLRTVIKSSWLSEDVTAQPCSPIPCSFPLCAYCSLTSPDIVAKVAHPDPFSLPPRPLARCHSLAPLELGCVLKTRFHPQTGNGNVSRLPRQAWPLTHWGWPPMLPPIFLLVTLGRGSSPGLAKQQRLYPRCLAEQ